jgi:hypothetical protein
MQYFRAAIDSPQRRREPSQSTTRGALTPKRIVAKEVFPIRPAAAIACAIGLVKSLILRFSSGATTTVSPWTASRETASRWVLSSTRIPGLSIRLLLGLEQRGSRSCLRYRLSLNSSLRVRINIRVWVRRNVQVKCTDFLHGCHAVGSSFLEGNVSVVVGIHLIKMSTSVRRAFVAFQSEKKLIEAQ